VSAAALCGVPFFSGFFSKDEIIDSAGHFHYGVFMIVGLIGAFMTTAYMTRATYLTFFGDPRGAAAHLCHASHSHSNTAPRERQRRGARRRAATSEAEASREPTPVHCTHRCRSPKTDSPGLICRRLMILRLPAPSSPATSMPRVQDPQVRALARVVDRPGDREGHPEPPTFEWVKAFRRSLWSLPGSSSAWRVQAGVRTRPVAAEGSHQNETRCSVRPSLPGQQVLPR
jgi:hypothetical protein